MAFPAGLTLITVSGQVAGLPEGQEATVTFAWPWLQGPADDAFVAAGRSMVVCDPDGAFEVALPATDDPGWSPTGWLYRVTITTGARVHRGAMALPYDGGPVDLADAFNPDGAEETGVTYALVGHTHPGGGEGGPIGISDVTGLTAALAGKAPTVHTHAVADVTGLQTALDNRATDAELTALDDRVVMLEGAPGGGGSALVVRRATVTSGNVTLAVSVPWAAVAGGPSMVLPAVAGDYVEFALASMLGNFGVNFLDLAVLAGGSLVRFLSSGTATAATEGAPAFYGDQAFDRVSPLFEFEVEAGDLDGGNVTVVFATKGSGGGTIYANADYPLRWRALNHGPVDVA